MPAFVGVRNHRFASRKRIPQAFDHRANIGDRLLIRNANLHQPRVLRLAFAERASELFPSGFCVFIR